MHYIVYSSSFSTVVRKSGGRRKRKTNSKLFFLNINKHIVYLLLLCTYNAMYKDHLHDVKIIHMGPSPYSDAMVKEKGVARSANARADKVNGQFLTKARKLDTECFSSEPDVEERPGRRKRRAYPGVRGQCVGAFAECSSDIHLLLREAARCAAIRYWRQVGAVSVEVAVAI